MKKIFLMLFTVATALTIVFSCQELHAEEIPSEVPTETPTVIPSEIPTVDPSVPTETVVPTEVVPTEEIVPSEVPTETPSEVGFSDMVTDFLDKWFVIITGTCGGVLGTLLTVVLSGLKVKNLTKQINDITFKNSKDQEKVLEEYVNAKSMLSVAVNDFKDECLALKETCEKAITDNKELLGKINSLAEQNVKFRKIIAVLVSTCKEFAQNENVKKVLDFLDDEVGE